MISRRLVDEIERHAGKLSADFAHAVTHEHRMPVYHSLGEQRVHVLARDLYQNLGHWLRSRSIQAVQTTYERLGRDRFHAAIPLDQLLCGLTLTKSQLLDFIQHSLTGDASERDLQLNLVLSISQFFDRAIYHAVAGYEDARRAAITAPLEETFPVLAAVSRPPNSERSEVEDLSISRSGEIGEVSG